MTFTDSKERFSNRAADYLRYRPSYPAAVIEFVRGECGLRPGHVIADVGSGTGFLSELFLKNGARGLFKADAELGRDDGGERGFAEAGRTVEQNVIHRFSALFGGFDGDG